MEYATKYNPRRVDGVGNFEPTLTQQHFANEVNINSIMARYNRTGLFPQSNETLRFEDVSNFPDFHAMQNKLAMAKEEFMRLPANIRKRFNNDSVQLLDFLSDEKNRLEAERLGLVNAPVLNEVVEKVEVKAE